MPPPRSLRAIVRHAESSVGRTHASTVSALVKSREPASGTTTLLLLPLNARAEPYLPALAHVAPDSVPVLVCPELSVAVVPLPSSKPYAATKPGDAGAGANVAV